MDIMVDSSVWIDFFNYYKSKEADELQNLVEHNNVNNIFICPTIYMEVLRGIKNDNTFYDVKETIDLFNNTGNSIIPKWVGERRHKMPKRFFLSGCTG